MKTELFFRRSLLACAVSLAVAATPAAANDNELPGEGVIVAQHSDHHDTHTGGGGSHDRGTASGGGGGGQQRQGKGAGSGEARSGRSAESDIFRDEGRGTGRGGSSDSDVFRDEGRGGPSADRGSHEDGEEHDHEDGEEESDRPEWAGTPGPEGKPGGGSSGDGGKKGELYGDLFVILRDDQGNPILANGYVQPCLDPACNEYIQLEDGEIPEAYADQILEAEFGRLNVSRAPPKVLDHALTEFLAKVDGAEITLANIADMTDESGRIIDLLGNTVDSPLENLAFYKALLRASDSEPVNGFYTVSINAEHEGETLDLDLKVAENVLMPLAASAIAAASDKYGNLTVDDVVYISTFLGVNNELSNLVTNYTYSRDTTFTDQVWILEPVTINGETVYQPTQVNVLDLAGFNTVPSIDNDSDGIDIFVQHADDAVQVLEFVHDNAIDAPE